MRKDSSSSAQDLFEPAGLDAALGGLGVAVHRVAAPEHLLAAAPDRLGQRRQALLHAVRAEAVDEGEAARFVLRVEHLGQRQRFVGRDGRADLDADGIGDAAEVLDVRAVQRAGAVADPGEVGGEVIPAGAARHLAGLGLLVIAGASPSWLVKKSTRLMSASTLPVSVSMNRSESPMRLDHARVFGGVRRVGHKAQLPVFRVVQVGKAAFDQRADEIDRQAGPLVGAQQQVRVRRALRQA